MKQILRLFILFSLITIPSMVRGTISVSFTATPTSGCTSFHSSITPTGTGCAGTPIYAYYYVSPLGDTVVGGSSHLFNIMGTYTIGVRMICAPDTAWAWSSTGGGSSVTVHSGPVISFTTTNPAIDTVYGCPGKVVNFINTSNADTTGCAYTWNWLISGTDGSSFTASTRNVMAHSFPNPGLYTVTLLYFAIPCNCFGNVTQTAYIKIDSPTTACFFRSDSSAICSAPATVTYHNCTNPGTASTFEWHFGDGTPPTTLFDTSAASHTYTSAGMFLDTMIAYSSLGHCPSSDTGSITIGNFAAHISHWVDTVCEGTTASFSDSSYGFTGGSASFAWYLVNVGTGDTASTVTGLNPVSFDMSLYGSGLFKVIDRPTNGAGCVASTSRTFWVRPRPSIAVTYSDTTYRCTPPLTASFHVLFAGADSVGLHYHWMFSGTASDTLDVRNAVHIYTSSGTFSPKLIVKDAWGCKDSLNNPNYIVVSQPTMTLTRSIDSGCTPITMHYSLSVLPSTVDYITDTVFFGDGGFCAGAACNDSAHIYTTGGHFQIKVKYHLPAYEGGCADTLIDTVVIGATHPHFNSSVHRDSVCPHTVIVFNDSCTNCTSVAWSILTCGALYTATTDTTSLNYSCPGTYAYNLIATVNGCSDTLFDTVHVFLPDTGTITVTTPSCAHRDTFQFHVLGAGDGYDTAIGAYHWDFGGGVTGTGNPINHHFSTTGVHTVAVVSTGNAANHFCTNTDTLHFDNTPPNLSYHMDATVLCKNVIDTFFGPANHDGSPYYFYTWHWGDGTPNTGHLLDSIAVHSFTAPGLYYDTLFITDGSGCLDTSLRHLVTVTGPVGGFTAIDTFICAGDVVHFHDANTDASAAIVSRMWDYNITNAGGGVPGTTFVPGVADEFIHYPNRGYFRVVLSDTDVNHCYSLDTRYVRAVKPYAFYSTPDSNTVLCPGLVVPLHDTNTHCTYSWSVDGGATWSAPSATDHDTSISFTTNGTYHVIVRVSALAGFGFPAGCTDTFGRTFVVGHVPATFTNALPTTGACPPLPVYAYVVPIDYSYAWYLYHGSTLIASTTGGTIPNDFALDYTLTGTGAYTAKVVYTTALGCVDSASASYFIGGPTGFITISTDSGCVPFAMHATFTNTGTTLSGTNYIWNTCPYGSITTTIPSLDLSYTDTGIFCAPTVTIQDGACVVDIDNLFADSVRAYPVPAITVNHPPILCYGSSTTLTASGSDSYIWTPTTFLSSPTSATTGVVSPTVTPVIAYTVTGTTIHGCVSSAVAFVFVDSPVHLTISGKDSICIGECDMLIAHGITGAKYSWSGIGTSCAVCDTNIVCPTVTRVYTAKGSNANGCADSTTFKVIVNPAPVLSYTPDPAHVCLYQPGTQITASGASKYVWRPNLSLSCDSCSNPVCSIPSNLIYTVTGTSIYGCKDSIYVPVVVYDTTQAHVRTDTVICDGSKAQLWAVGGVQYLWTPATGLSSTSVYDPIATPNVTTVYTVTIIENACNTRTMDVQVTVIPLPQLKVPPSVTIIAGNSVQLYVDTLNHVYLTTYIWTPSDTTLSCSDCPDPIATPTASTTYSVTAATVEGCAGSATVTIKLICENTQVFIPNTFTPNGDGVNDRFFVSGKGLGLIKRMAIYNRWGQLVYEGLDIPANDPGLGWDGTFRGDVLAPDVYVYVLDILCETGEPFSFKGDISLVR